MVMLFRGVNEKCFVAQPPRVGAVDAADDAAAQCGGWFDA